MPGFTKFVAGFVQCESYLLPTIKGLTRFLILATANVGDTSPNTYVTIHCKMRAPVQCFFKVSGLSARVLVNLIMGNLAISTLRHAAVPLKTATDGMLRISFLSVSEC